jgi:hypothetical protein
LLETTKKSRIEISERTKITLKGENESGHLLVDWSTWKGWSEIRGLNFRFGVPPVIYAGVKRVSQVKL